MEVEQLSNLDDAARQVGFWSAVKELAVTRCAEARARYIEMAAETGIRAQDVRSEDGTKLVGLSVSEQRLEGRVVDARAFTAWVAARYPEHITTITAVISSFEKVVLGWATEDGGPPADRATGELIPGVDVMPAGGVLTVRPTTAGKARYREQLDSGGSRALGG
jgi:hypothetical protein